MTEQLATPKIGILTALPQEYTAVKAILENTQEYTVEGGGAGRRYVQGEVPAQDRGKHSVVLALADMGNNIAATRATLLLNHFPEVKSIIMVGIAGGIPNPNKSDDHVRLGDIVVSDQKGVIQYDFIQETIEENKNRYLPRPPSPFLLEGVRLLEANKLGVGEKKPWLNFIQQALFSTETKRPLAKTDILKDSKDSNKKIKHPRDNKRIQGQPRVFYGSIASANVLLKNPMKRDKLRDTFGVKAVEMESSGIADATWNHDVGYLVVRGICDYCDSNKNDIWQPYAAAVAAAYTRALLESMPAEQPDPNGPDPLEKHFNDVAQSIRSGKLIFFLGSGINFSNRQTNALPPNDIQIAKELSKSCKFKTKELIGLPCDVCPYKLQERPDDPSSKTPLCPIKQSVGNLPHLQHEQDLVVAKVDIRCLSQFIITDTVAGGLMEKLSRYFRRKYSPNKIQYLLAYLAASMKKSRFQYPYQLIITTNYDLGLERAFEQAFKGNQTTFDVISYIAEGDNCGYFKHIYSPKDKENNLDSSENTSLTKVEVIGKKEVQANQYKNLPLKGEEPQLPTVEHPIILKLLGGALHNLPKEEDSFAIAPSHLLNYMSGIDGKKPSLSTLLPQKLIQLLNASDILFIGFSANDADLQMLLSRVCPDRSKISKNTAPTGKPQAWLIHQSSPGELSNENFWRDQWAVELVECTYEKYVNKLRDYLEQRSLLEVVEIIR